MVSFRSCASSSAIRKLKNRYLQSLAAPMDGMWDTGFTDPAPHWEILWDGERAGYYAANDEGALLQIYVVPRFLRHARDIFARVVEQDSIVKAEVSTIDPVGLSMCLDLQKDVSVHTHLYQLEHDPEPVELPSDVGFRLVENAELDRTVAFQELCLGRAEELTDWLRGYSGNLIERNELFALERGDDWIGLGELRRSDTQPGIADLGMMVSPDFRRAGWGSLTLRILASRCSDEGLRPVCSTTVENAAARSAIAKAGFVSRHRIMTIQF